MGNLNLMNHNNLIEKLGFNKKDKLLILHADDLGLSHSTNVACISALENGTINSASIMVPCPYFEEIATYAKENSTLDFGVHLTFTSEWNTYRWSPISPVSEVTSLVDEKGFFHKDVNTFSKKAKIREVEIEIRAQIEKALSSGINITHVDNHMFSLFHPKFYKTYLSTVNEYRVPALLSKSFFNLFSIKYNNSNVLIDNLFVIPPQAIKKGAIPYYTRLLKKIPSGITQIIVHPSYDNDEMQAITGNSIYGAALRQSDYDFFTSQTCKQILVNEMIQLITWKNLNTVFD